LRKCVQGSFTRRFFGMSHAAQILAVRFDGDGERDDY
jgi:hypothetical protein